MLKSCLCDCGNAYKLVKETITIILVPPLAANPNNNDKEVVFKNCAPFTDCISEINNTKIDYAKESDVVMPMCNLTEHNDNYSNASGNLWQHYRDEPALADAEPIANFHGANKWFI